MKLIPLIWFIGSLIWLISFSVQFSFGNNTQAIANLCCAAIYISVAAMYLIMDND